MTARLPPHNFEAEQALLGRIVTDNSAYQAVAEFLRLEHFADPLHGKLFGWLSTTIDGGGFVNAAAMKGYVERSGDLREAGGVRYIAQLASAGFDCVDPAADGRIILDCYLRRELLGLGALISARAMDGPITESAADQIVAAEKQLYEIADGGREDAGFQPFAVGAVRAIEAASAAFTKGGELTGVSTGLAELDALLGGLHRSDLVILAGRPSMGKTALATGMAFHAAKFCAVPTGFFSLEMSAEQLSHRVISGEAGVSSERVRRGELRGAEFDRYLTAADGLQGLPLLIDETAGLTLAALRTRARRLKRTHGIGLLVVDYLQLIVSPAVRARQENRSQEVSEITRGLKLLAKELDIPVVALSQLSREVEKRDDKRPQLADLRDSGAIEQDADVVMFVYRDEYYLGREQPKKRADESDEKFTNRIDGWDKLLQQAKGKAEVIVSKQRHGRTGEAHLAFDGGLARFSNLVEDDGGLF